MLVKNELLVDTIHGQENSCFPTYKQVLNRPLISKFSVLLGTVLWVL